MRQQEEKPLWLQVQGWLIDSGFEFRHELSKHFGTWTFYSLSIIKDDVKHTTYDVLGILHENGLSILIDKYESIVQEILKNTTENFKQRIRNYMLNFAFDDIFTLHLYSDPIWNNQEKPMEYYDVLSKISVNVYLKNPNPNDVMEFANEPDFPEFDYWCKANRATWLDHDFVLRLIVEVANELYYETRGE